MEIKSQITFQDILNTVTEEDIFKYYIPEFKQLNKKFLSPFQKERTPSCSIFDSGGRLYYKDFCSGNGGSCFDYIQKKYNLTFNECLTVIASDFKIKPNLSVKYNPSDLGFSKEHTPKQMSKIRIKSINWTKEGLAYWQQYGLEKDDLTDVKQIGYFWLNGNRFKTDLAFAYDFNWYEQYTYQILQPNNKEFKWFSNTPDSLVMGWNLLPKKGKKLIITSSYKDVLLLRKLGHVTCSPKSESTIIPQLIMGDLDTRFEDKYTYFNNDKVGIEFASRYNELYNTKNIVNQFCMPKDPSDLIKKYGNKGITIINNLINGN